MSENLITQDQLFRICKKHGLPWHEPEELLRTGIVNHAIAIGDVVIRIPCDPEWAQEDTRTEAVAVPAALKAGIRTPEAVLFDFDLDIVPTIFSVYRRVAGRPWMQLFDDPAVTEATGHFIGRSLRQLHDSVVEAPDPNGWLDDHGMPTTERFIQESLQNGTLEPETAAWLLAWHETLMAQTGQVLEQKVFCHGDLHECNVLVEPGQAPWIIDWGDAGWADPSVDFGNMHPGTWVATFAGYGEVEDPAALRAASTVSALERCVGRLASGVRSPSIGNALVTKLVRLLRFFQHAPPEWAHCAPPAGIGFKLAGG